MLEKVACAFSLHAFITILLAACSLIQAKVVQNFCMKSHNWGTFAIFFLIQAQEENFKLQNQTLLEEITKVMQNLVVVNGL